MPENGTPRNAAAYSRLLRSTLPRVRTPWTTGNWCKSAKRWMNLAKWSLPWPRSSTWSSSAGSHSRKSLGCGTYQNARCSGTGRRRAFISIGRFVLICRSEESMSTLSPDQWQALSPYLDQALAMPEDERAAWLSSLGEQNSALAAQLRALLAEHRVLAH